MEGTLVDFVIKIIEAISALLTATAAVWGLIFAKKVIFTNETLYGKEATERYQKIKDNLPNEPSCKFGPEIYGGGNIAMPQLEIKKVPYDPQTMPSSWKGTKKIVRYYYEKDGNKMVESWRLK